MRKDPWDLLGLLEHKGLQGLRDPQDPPVRMVQMAPPDLVPTKFGWPKEIRARRQTLLLPFLPEDPQGPPDRLDPQGRQELPAHKDPQVQPDHKDLLEPKVLWVLPELRARKGRQVQQEPTVRTANPCSTVPSILQLAQVRLATSI